MPAPATQAASADLPAVSASTPRQTVRVSWLAATAATAATANLLNRLPTVVRSLPRTAVTNPGIWRVIRVLV